MDSLLSGLVDQFGGDAVGAVAGRLGIAPETAKKAFATAALAAMAAQATSAEGSAGLLRTLSGLSGGGGGAGLGGLLGSLVTGGRGESGLGQLLGGLLKDPGAMEQGASMAKNLFGDRMDVVERGLAKESGIKPETMGSLLSMAVPAVMGSVAGLARSKSLDAAGLTSFLGGEVKSLAKSQPDLMGSLGS